MFPILASTNWLMKTSFLLVKYYKKQFLVYLMFNDVKAVFLKTCSRLLRKGLKPVIGFAGPPL